MKRNNDLAVGLAHLDLQAICDYVLEDEVLADEGVVAALYMLLRDSKQHPSMTLTEYVESHLAKII